MDKVAVQIVSDGRVTIPSDVREEMGLEKGDYVLLDIEPINDS